jgi:hypothetical protein
MGKDSPVCVRSFLKTVLYLQGNGKVFLAHVCFHLF